LFCLQVGGFLLASAVTTITRSILSKDQVDAWGWRVPFLFSLLLAPLLYHVVNNAEESKLWAERSTQKETEQMIRETENASDRPAIVDLFSSPFRRRQLAGMVGVLGGITSSFYTLFLWTPVYLSELRGVLNEKDADLMNFVVVGVYIFFVLLAGKLSDKFPHRMDLFRIGFPGIIVGAPAMFAMFESESVLGYFLAQIMFAFCLALVEGGKAAWEVELWMADPTLSFTGVAIGHNIAATLFGGTLPLVATFLFYRAQKLQHDDILWPSMLPGFYIAILGCIALYCISCVVRHPHDIRTGGAKLKEAVERENRRDKELKQKKKKKQKQQMFEEHLGGCSVYNLDHTDENYVPPRLS
jgi:MFS transporter, MHS family, proline/betaine transporter